MPEMRNPLHRDRPNAAPGAAFGRRRGAAHRLLCRVSVVVMRCAWHRKYRGYPWIYSIGAWRGRELVVSDGMCRSCARRWRDEFRAGRLFTPVTPPLVPAWMPRVGVALALTSAVVFAARPLDPATAGRPAPPSGGGPMLAAEAAGTPATARPAARRGDCPPGRSKGSVSVARARAGEKHGRRATADIRRAAGSPPRFVAVAFADAPGRAASFQAP
jgi:hypothetical protein